MWIIHCNRYDTQVGHKVSERERESAARWIKNNTIKPSTSTMLFVLLKNWCELLQLLTQPSILIRLFATFCFNSANELLYPFYGLFSHLLWSNSSTLTFESFCLAQITRIKWVIYAASQLTATNLRIDIIKSLGWQFEFGFGLNYWRGRHKSPRHNMFLCLMDCCHCICGRQKHLHPSSLLCVRLKKHLYLNIYIAIGCPINYRTLISDGPSLRSTDRQKGVAKIKP